MPMPLVFEWQMPIDSDDTLARLFEYKRQQAKQGACTSPSFDTSAAPNPGSPISPKGVQLPSPNRSRNGPVLAKTVRKRTPGLGATNTLRSTYS